jgi:hypothetical protein
MVFAGKLLFTPAIFIPPMRINVNRFPERSSTVIAV